MSTTYQASMAYGVSLASEELEAKYEDEFACAEDNADDTVRHLKLSVAKIGADRYFLFHKETRVTTEEFGCQPPLPTDTESKYRVALSKGLAKLGLAPKSSECWYFWLSSF